ncbi:thioredoxin family protein [uncultured Hyphomicrobium sp.]|uniref:thioredoxin family protein n=1 Tax=uncultured Hyphomicrobium sp. TaxID=194373 RepID=UPI0025E6472F|nr:thioredoxin family protein [uncultured Hyphomicrobium sp.]
MSFKGRRRRCGAFLLFAALFFVGFGLMAPLSEPARSASDIRLLMVVEPGCRFCRAWDSEIGPGYRKSAEGRFAPLKRVRRGAPETKGLAPIVYTPTFVVMRSGEELGRITGYPGADYFYGELRPLLAAAGFFPSL